jgi:hypothetical protein
MNDVATAATAAPATTPPPPAYDWAAGREPPFALAGIAYFAPLYEYAVLADRKASFFMSAGGLMLTVLGFFIGRVVNVLSVGGWVAWAFGAVLASVVVLVVVAGVTSYVAFATLLPPTPPSLAVFRDIARRSFDDYARDVRALSHAQAFTDAIRFNHVIAAWAAGKFRLVNRALALLRVAIPLWMLLLLVLAFSG